MPDATPSRYSINVTLDGCCDHRAIPADEDLHRHHVGTRNQKDSVDQPAPGHLPHGPDRRCGDPSHAGHGLTHSRRPAVISDATPHRPWRCARRRSRRSASTGRAGVPGPPR
ncbi:hypothetical protein E1258_09900 [Micromonospora sp. KC207]|nr:hypothetical protein E1258_09900 [Micromonospora sp. KC207]